MEWKVFLPSSVDLSMTKKSLSPPSSDQPVQNRISDPEYSPTPGPGSDITCDKHKVAIAAYKIIILSIVILPFRNNRNILPHNTGEFQW